MTQVKVVNNLSNGVNRNPNLFLKRSGRTWPRRLDDVRCDWHRRKERHSFSCVTSSPIRTTSASSRGLGGSLLHRPWATVHGEHGSRLCVAMRRFVAQDVSAPCGVSFLALHVSRGSPSRVSVGLLVLHRAPLRSIRRCSLQRPGCLRGGNFRCTLLGCIRGKAR